MVKPIVYYHPISPPSRAVLLVAREIGLDLDLRVIDILSGAQFSPEYLQLNPFHIVPTLVDGDHVVWDSHAIIPYLVDKYAKSDNLYPKDLAIRSIINQRLHFDSGILSRPGKGLIRKILNNGTEYKYSQDLFDEITASNVQLNLLLGENKYLTGNTMTIADFSCVSTLLYKAIILPFDKKEFPHLAAWIRRMKDLPYFDEVYFKPVEPFKKMLSDTIEKK